MTLFKLNPLAAAVAAALSFGAGQALAITAFETPDVDVYLSGASGPQSVLGGIAGKLFEAGYITYYDNGGTSAVGSTSDDGKNYRAYFGVVKNDPSINSTLVGKKLMILNRAKGGSAFGVISVAKAQAIATMQITSGSCVLDAGIYRCAEVGNDLATDANNRVPDFGVSDVEPNMFQGPINVEFGNVQLTAAEAARFTGTQFGASSLMETQVATDAVPATLKVSRADYGAMLSGLITTWDKVGDGSLTGNVAVCRRVQGSGTQAAYNNYYNNFPCAPGSSTVPARMSDSVAYKVGGNGTAATPYLIDPSAGYTVVENPSSGNVRDCLKAAQAGTDHTFTGDDGKVYKVQFSKVGGATKAIGVLSLDSLGQESGWSFRALDGAGRIVPAPGGVGAFSCTNSNQLDCGIAPTKANQREAAYDFSAELSFQYRNAAVGAVPALAGLKKDAADQFIKFVGDPDVLNTLGAAAKEATIALPINFDPTTNSNVAKATRFGNSCAPLQKAF
jgi:hypothetical protein